MDFSDTVARSILTAASDAVVATDRVGVIRFWNPGAERIFQYSNAEALGRPLDLIIPEHLRARHWTGYARVMETSETRYGHGDILAVPGLRKDGARISLEFTILLLKDADGRMQGLAAVLRDVTARFEEMRELKRRLAAGVASPAQAGGR